MMSKSRVLFFLVQSKYLTTQMMFLWHVDLIPTEPSHGQDIILTNIYINSIIYILIMGRENWEKGNF